MEKINTLYIFFKYMRIKKYLTNNEIICLIVRTVLSYSLNSHSVNHKQSI